MKYRMSVVFLFLFLLFQPCSVLAAPKIGLIVYKKDDPFMESLADEIIECANGKAEIFFKYSESSQSVQNRQIESFLDDQMDVLILNAQDCVSAIYPIRMAMKNHTPIVFINCEPLREDMQLYSSAYFVGTDPKQLGIVCGEIVSDYWTENPEADKNQDGIMQVVILQGSDDQNGILRTQSTIDAVQRSGIVMEILDRKKAYWTRSDGREEMSNMLKKYGSDIEMVICNNDEMAIGAVDALQLAGYFSDGNYMPVVGIDGTQEGLKFVESGFLLGTVTNEVKLQADRIFETAMRLADGTLPGQENEHYIYISGKKVISSEILSCDNDKMTDRTENK